MLKFHILGIPTYVLKKLIENTGCCCLNQLPFKIDESELLLNAALVEVKIDE